MNSDHWIRWALFGVVRLYQRAVSPLLIPSCRFEPSCSHYALEVLQTWPLVRGMGLILKRLARCHPFCRSGFDPVPPYRGPAGRHRVLFRCDRATPGDSSPEPSRSLPLPETHADSVGGAK